MGKLLGHADLFPVIECADAQLVAWQGSDVNVQGQLVDSPTIRSIFAGQVAEVAQIQRHHQVSEHLYFSASQGWGRVTIAGVNLDINKRVVLLESGDQATH